MPDPEQNVVTVLDIATRAESIHAADAPWVVIGSQPYLPAILSTGAIRRHLFQPQATLGDGVAEIAAIVLDNTDRRWDRYHRLVDGRPITQRRASRSSRNPDDYTQLFAGVIETATYKGNEWELQVLSRRTAIAEELVQTKRYDGTATTGEAGVGGGEDLEGKPEPILIGSAFNVSPPRANPHVPVFQLSTGWPGHAVAIEFVRDSGADIAAGTQHPTLAALLATAPSAGTYDWYSGDDGTYFVLGSAASGEVTVAATEGGGRTIAECAERILLRSTRLVAGDVHGVGAMNAAMAGQGGVWFGASDTTIGQALTEVLSGIGSWVDNLDDQSVTLYPWGQLPAVADQDINADTGVLGAGTDRDWETLDEGIDLVSTQDVGGGAAVSEVIVGYQRNYTVQTRTQVAGVAEPRIARLEQDWLTVSAVDDAARAVNALTPPMRINTALASKSDAERVAALQLDLRRGGIDIYRVPISALRVATDIGGTIRLTSNKYGLERALCGVLGREDSGRTVQGAQMTTLIVWRPSEAL